MILYFSLMLVNDEGENRGSVVGRAAARTPIPCLTSDFAITSVITLTHIRTTSMLQSFMTICLFVSLVGR